MVDDDGVRGHEEWGEAGGDLRELHPAALQDLCSGDGMVVVMCGYCGYVGVSRRVVVGVRRRDVLSLF